MAPLQIATKAIQTTFRKIWQSCGSLFNCSVTSAQIWFYWKSHQRETSPVSSPQNSGPEVWKNNIWTSQGHLRNKSRGAMRLKWRQRGGGGFHEEKTCPAVEHEGGSFHRHTRRMDSILFQHILEADIKPSLKEAEIEKLLKSNNDPHPKIHDELPQELSLFMAHGRRNSSCNSAHRLKRKLRAQCLRNLKDLCDEGRAKKITQMGSERLLAAIGSVSKQWKGELALYWGGRVPKPPLLPV